MFRIISTKMNNMLVSAVTEDLDIKEFSISPHPDEKVNFCIGDIVIGRITNIVKNIGSIFIEIFPGVEGYLNYKDDTTFVYTNGKEGGKPVVSDTVLVQIEKEPTKTKSYTLTTDFTFMSKVAVLKPALRKIHISSRFRNHPNYKEVKKRFTEIGEKFLQETGSGFIARWASLELSDEEFLNSLYDLYSTYLSVLHRGRHGVQYERIFKDLPPHLRLLRDNHDNIEKIMTDDRTTYNEYLSYIEKDAVFDKAKMFFYEDEYMSLSNLYSIKTTLEKCLSKKVWLNSGAYIVIEYTEALTVIDVNSGKAISGKSVRHDTFLKINLEAAKEIANQMRLRNLSGIIVVDFIDLPKNYYSTLINAMKDYLKNDSTNSSVAGITNLGLMEITRRRTGRPLHEYTDLHHQT